MVNIDVVLAFVLAVASYGAAGRLSDPQSLISRMCIAAYLVVVQLILVGYALLLADVYTARYELAVGALLAVGLRAMVARRQDRSTSPWRFRAGDATLLMLAVVVAFVGATPGFQTTAMGSDAGVYINRALQLSTDGSTFPSVGIDIEKLPSQLRSTYLDQNTAPIAGAAVALVGGAKIRSRSGTGTIEFHALPAWPILLSVSAHLFGAERMQIVAGGLLLLLGMTLYQIMTGSISDRLLSAATAVATMVLPIVIYFSRYPTAELLLTTLFAGIVYFLAQGRRYSGLLAGLLVTTYALTHMSGFLLIAVACAIAVLVAAHVSQARRHELSSFLLTGGGGLLVAVLCSLALSNGYVTDLLIIAFGSTQMGLVAIAAISVVAMSIGLTCLSGRGDEYAP